MAFTEPKRVLPIVQSVQVGRVAPLGPDGVLSGFVKPPVLEPVRVGKLNLEGDAQADLSMHGGLEKAVYAYPASRYAEWLADYPQHATRFVPGCFGENLTIAGLDETGLCAGDVHAIGTARLQVCQPRQPCFKFALRFEDASMPHAMVKSGRSGWYYRVIEEGTLIAGDAVHLVDRPNPDLAFQTLIKLVYWRRATLGELELIATATGIPRWLNDSAELALRSDAVERRSG